MNGDSVRYEHAVQHPPIPDNRLLWAVVRLAVAAGALLAVWWFVPGAFTGFGSLR